jgi:ribosomal-protein-serine acetyltransferase
VPGEPIDVRGERVRLRPLRPDELEPLLEEQRGSAVTVGTLSRETLRARIARSGRFVHGRLDLAIEADGRLVGIVDVRAPAEAVPPGVCELGIELFEGERGRGLGTDAVRVLSETMLAAGFVRVQVSTDVRNAPMRRVLEKLGFAREGTMRSFMPDGDGRADYVLYARTRDDVE